MRSRALIALIALVWPAAAAADPLGTFGASPRTASVGHAAVAMPADSRHDYAAAFHNPAMAAQTEGFVFGVGYRYANTRLQLGGETLDNGHARGTLIGLAHGHELWGGLRGGAAAILYMPDQHIVRFRMLPATRPYFVKYENRPHRVAAELSYGIGGWFGLSLGLGVSVLADAVGTGITIDLEPDTGRLDDPDAQRVETNLDLSLPPRAAPVLGLQWQLPWLEALRLGFSFRGELSMRISIETTVNVDAFPIQGDARLAVRHDAYFTPAQISLGASYALTPKLRLMAQLDWQQWSAFESGVPQIEVSLDLGVPYEPPVAEPEDALVRFEDVWVPRIGAEWTVYEGGWLRALNLRAGGFFEASPVPEQVGSTNLLDADKVVGTAGAGVWVGGGEIVPQGFMLSVDLQYHHLLDRHTRKRRASDPYGELRIGGELWQVAVSAGMKL